MQTKTVVFLAYDSAMLLDLAGPIEVFTTTNAFAEGQPYRVTLASVDGRDMLSSAGPRLGVDCRVADLEWPVDTFIVPGTHAWAQVMQDRAILDALILAADQSRRLAAVCAGTFLLAAAGLLDGRPATTHWQLADELSSRFPTVRVDPNPIFIRDGRIFTSAGVTAGIDLALAMVEEDHGAELARDVARYLVVFMQRPGGQAQFSARLRSPPRTHSRLRVVLDSITENPAADHRLSLLSERVGYSERHLTRIFARELGMTPARYVESVRVEAACLMLESSDATLEVIARESGLHSAETLRRCFRGTFGVTPNAYRLRFRTTGITGTHRGDGQEPIRVHNA